VLIHSLEPDYHDLKIPSPAPAFGRIAVFLALLNVNLGNMLFLGDPAARIASCFLGLVLIASLLRADWLRGERAFRPGSIIPCSILPCLRCSILRCSILSFASLASVLLFLGSKELGFIGLICALGCLSAIGHMEENQEQIRIFVTATGLLALFDYGYTHTALVWYAVRQINQFLMSIFTAATGRQMPFGHHASGLFILIPFVFYFFALVFHWVIKKRKFTEILEDFLIFFLLILLNQAFYLLVQQIILSRLQFNVYQASFLITPFETLWLAFLLSLIPLYLINKKSRKPKPQRHGDTEKNTEKSTEKSRALFSPGICLSATAAFLVAFICVAALSFFTIYEWRALHFSPPGGKTILIYDNLDWSVPEFGYYGERSGGMFGNLPDFLSSLGYAVSVDKEISQEKLQRVDLLVIINLMEKFNESTKNTIHNYIKAGGNLLIMGDHTGLGFIREPFNDLLKPVPISFQFDSACSLVPSWQNCMEIRPHPITEHAATENDVQIGTGASLAVAYPAKPIMVGKRAFSDPGDRANSRDGFLGDLQYQKSEWLGDIVLAAEAEFGQGKFLVFGDTSSLQNGALPYDRQFIQDIFQWLTVEDTVQSRGRYLRPLFMYLRPLLWFLFLLALAVAWCEHPVAATLCLVVSLYLVPARFFPLPDYPPRGGKAEIALVDKSIASIDKSIAYIDNSHGEFFDLTGWQKNSLDGLAYNLMRNHYAPFITKDLDSELLDNSKVWVFISPTRSFSQKEKEHLHHFMTQGGIIFWAASWTVKESSASFLGDFGLSLANLPLGPVKEWYEEYRQMDGDVSPAPGYRQMEGDAPSASGYEVQFQDAWPIRIEKRFKDQSTVLLQKDDYPLVVFQRYGRGGILLISDSRFLLNQNLENINNFYREGNIFFIRDIMKKITPQGYNGKDFTWESYKKISQRR